MFARSTLSSRLGPRDLLHLSAPLRRIALLFPPTPASAITAALKDSSKHAPASASPAAASLPTYRMMFLGAPGAGKGTFASRIAPQLGIPVISTGDMIRAEIKKKSALGKELQSYSDAGALVPDEIVTRIAQERLSQPDCQRGFILDGFPRTLRQAQLLEQIVPLNVVLNIDFPMNLLVQKISCRRVCNSCGKNYNLASIKEGELELKPLLPKKEGVCDDCQGKLVQRDDDKEDVVRSRLEIYKRDTAPLIEYYRRQKVLVDFRVKKGVDDTPEVVTALTSFVKKPAARS